MIPCVAPAYAPDTVWTKTYGGEYTDIGCEVLQTIDGGYIILGYTNSYGAGGYDVWLLKTDAWGDTVWTKTIGGAYDDYGYSLDQTADGGYICVGMTNSFTGGQYGQVFLIKTDSNGDTVWTKTYSDSVTARVVRQTYDGGYMIGYIHTYPYWPYSSGYVLKTGASGNIIWTASVGEDCQEATPTTDHGYIIIGGYHESSHFWYPCYVKIDSVGDPLWGSWFGSMGWGRSVDQTQDRSYILLSDGGLTKVCEYGTIVWQKSLGVYNLRRVRGVRNTGYVIAGSRNFGGVVLEDVYVVRTDTLGDTLWTITYGGDGRDAGYSIACTDDGGYIITGCTQVDDLWLLKIDEDSVGVEEHPVVSFEPNSVNCIIDRSFVFLHDERARIYDVAGRCVQPDNPKPGIYFVVVDEKIKRKVIIVK